MIFIAYLLTGIMAGTLAGLLGIGGGIVIVPILSTLLLYTDVPAPLVIHTAIATSLAVIAITAMSSTLAHYRRNNIIWPIFWRMLPALLFGVIIGTLISTQLPGRWLEIFVAVMIPFIAYRLFNKAKSTVDVEHQEKLPPYLFFFLICTVASLLSALVGIGGGVLFVPLLRHYGFNMYKALGTTVVCTLTIALAATIIYIISAQHLMHLAPWSSGYIYWPAFFGIITTSVLCAPLGVKLAHRLPVKLLQKLFALLLIIVAIKMFL